MNVKEIEDYVDITLDVLNDPAKQDSAVRRNETICCLIGFGIGVGCCILYRLISNFLAPSSSSSSTTSISSNTLSSLSNKKRDAKALHMGQEHSSFSSNGNEITVTYTKRPRSSTSSKQSLPAIHHNANSTINRSHRPSYSNDSDREPLLGLPIDKRHESIPNKTFTASHLSDEMTWSEISSSLGTVGLLQDSYHSNSLTGDSGVDCQEISTIRSSRNQAHLHDLTTTSITTAETNPSAIIDDDDDDDESMINYSTNGTNTLHYSGSRRYDSDTALSRGVLLHDTQTATESHVMSYMSTEKGLDRALEQTSRFYSDLEHIATDLSSLSKRYSQSQISISPSLSKYYHQHNRPVFNTIDALDWDWHDVHSPPLMQSPKLFHRKQNVSSSLPRLNQTSTKTKVRRKLNHTANQTEYHESDLEMRTTRSYDCTSSPLKRRPSSVYFDSTDNTSGEENFGDETLQIASSPTVLSSSRTTEFFSTTTQ
ncbi:unnamed protein product [Adineta ricciae]|uniref:Uncharacterized protein n=1 Tax=Adineta ricciae TaxID=249248 RepID=A0A814SG30_ADIRI|nr:unnamed protein product [Adineta ricciae]